MYWRILVFVLSVHVHSLLQRLFKQEFFIAHSCQVQEVLFTTVADIRVSSEFLQGVDQLWLPTHIGKLHRIHFERVVLIVKCLLAVLDAPEKLPQTLRVVLV